MAAGLDSLGTVELRSTLQSRLGMQLPPTVVSVLFRCSASHETIYVCLRTSLSSSLIQVLRRSANATATVFSGRVEVTDSTGVKLPIVLLSSASLPTSTIAVTTSSHMLHLLVSSCISCFQLDTKMVPSIPLTMPSHWPR